MASAGVVGMAEVVTPSSAPSGRGLNGSPAMWSFVWVGASVLILVFLHLAIAGRAGRLCGWNTSTGGISGSPSSSSRSWLTGPGRGSSAESRRQSYALASAVSLRRADHVSSSAFCPWRVTWVFSYSISALLSSSVSSSR